MQKRFGPLSSYLELINEPREIRTNITKDIEEETAMVSKQLPPRIRLVRHIEAQTVSSN